jgi:hypothetical protein
MAARPGRISHSAGGRSELRNVSRPEILPPSDHRVV